MVVGGRSKLPQKGTQQMRNFMLWLFALMGLAGAQRTVYVYVWELKQELIGSYKEEVLTINGQSPGPTIQTHERERVSVTVTNRLREHVRIHWHNTRQIKEPGGDGIPPGETFTYVFIADRLGKSPYDSYYTRQSQTGLRGLIDVLPVYSMAVILNDQYYKSDYDWVALHESLLIPRKGKFDCVESTTPPTACNAIPEYSYWRVVPGRTYHLNITNVTSQSTLSFQIESHNLTVLEADGHYVVPSLIIYSGETCFVKIKANQASRNYQITTYVVGQDTTTTTPLGLAVLSYSRN